jgi:hypothetical protein
MATASNKVNDILNEGKQFKTDLGGNVSNLKNLASNLSRKEINFNFIEKISRMVYTNENYLLKVEFLQYIMFIALLYIYNPLDINTKFPVFTKLLVLIVSFIYVILFFFIKMKVEAGEDVDLIRPTEKNILIQFVSTIFMFIGFMLCIKGVLWLFAHTNILSLFQNMMTLFIIIGVIGIGYLAMKKTIDKAKNAHGKSVMKLFLKIVLYLPCLLIDLLDKVKYEFNLTTKPVWILCAVEAGFVGAWFLIPFLFQKVLNYDGLRLLTEPVDLDVEMTIGNFNKSRNPNDSQISLDQLYSDKANARAQKDLKEQPTDTLDNAPDTTSDYNDPNMPKNKYLAWVYKKIKHFTWLKISFMKHPQYTDYNNDRFSYSYSLSSWFYINPQPPNTKAAYSVYTNILNYGKKVAIEYNGKLNSLRVMAAVPAKNKATVAAVNATTNTANTNDSVEVYQTHDIMYQKWNNIVINYDNGIMDVFLNGVLVGSHSDVMPYMSFDTIVTGAFDGIMGGICNVNYYRNTQPEKTIRLNYKALRGKEFPYIASITPSIKINAPKRESNDKFKNDVKHFFGA